MVFVLQFLSVFSQSDYPIQTESNYPTRISAVRENVYFAAHRSMSDYPVQVGRIIRPLRFLHITVTFLGTYLRGLLPQRAKLLPARFPLSLPPLLTLEKLAPLLIPPMILAYL